jgi:hypothetical protein
MDQPSYIIETVQMMKDPEYTSIVTVLDLRAMLRIFVEKHHFLFSNADILS